MGAGRDQHQLVAKDDVDPPVLAILQPQDFLSRDDAVLDDPVQRAADQFVGALGTHPGRNAHFPADRARDDTTLERFDAGAGESDLGEMERHAGELGGNPRAFNP